MVSALRCAAALASKPNLLHYGKLAVGQGCVVAGQRNGQMVRQGTQRTERRATAHAGVFSGLLQIRTRFAVLTTSALLVLVSRCVLIDKFQPLDGSGYHT